MPYALSYLWGWYNELRRGVNTGGGMGGSSGITWRDILAWKEMMDRRPGPHEVDAFFDLDHVIRKVFEDHSERAHGR